MGEQLNLRHDNSNPTGLYISSSSNKMKRIDSSGVWGRVLLKICCHLVNSSRTMLVLLYFNCQAQWEHNGGFNIMSKVETHLPFNLHKSPDWDVHRRSPSLQPPPYILHSWDSLRPLGKSKNSAQLEFRTNWNEFLVRNLNEIKNW